MIHNALFTLLHISCVFIVFWLLFIKILERRKKTRTVEWNSLPETAVIVPVTGDRKNLKRNLLALLNQKYAEFNIYFVVQDSADAASPVVAQLIKDLNHASLIYAGKSRSCSQKNWNIIAGAKAAINAKILVFCDSGHLAKSNWLIQLVSPLLCLKKNIISSGYHQVLVNGFSIVEIGHAICVLGLRLARMTPGFEQPWGGSMAMTREVFDKLDVAGLWSSRVVDDVTLAYHLKKNGYSTYIPQDCDLKTNACNSWSDWSIWLTRQWAYLKFVFPVLWFFLGFLGILFSMSIFYCIAIIVLFPCGIISSSGLSGALLALVLVLFFSFLLRFSQPVAGPILLWFPAFFAALVMAGWCHFRTWFSASITWAGITYEVTAEGKVKKIQRS